MCDTLISQVSFTQSILHAEIQIMRMSGVFKNFKPVCKFHTSLKNLNQRKNLNYNIYMKTQVTLSILAFIASFSLK